MSAAGAPPRAPHGLMPRRRLVRLAHRLALFATMAAMAHLGAVLLIPRYAAQDAASVFMASGADGKAELLRAGSPEAAAIADIDPATAVAVCGFDLEDGPLRASIRAGQLPLSLSVQMRGGGVIYAVTDRAAQRGVIEFVVLTRAQYEARVAGDDDDAQRELRVVAPSAQGLVVARALARQPSDRAAAEALVGSMACGSAG